MPIERRRVVYGMDQDNSEIDIQNGFARYNLNTRIGSSSSDTIGAIENVAGNNLVFTPLAEGDNTIIGAFNYRLKNRVYYFSYNSLGNHSILEYDHETNSSRTIITSPTLDFDKNFLITGINVIDLDDDNDLIYWVESNKPPRKINIRRALNYGTSVAFTDNTFVLSDLGTLGFKFATPHNYVVGQHIQIVQAPGALNPSYDGEAYVVEVVSPTEILTNKKFLLNSPANPGVIYDLDNGYSFPLTEDAIDAIKYPPLSQPVAVYGHDESQKINFMTNKLFQYKAQYVYGDYEKSAWSPISINTTPSITSVSKALVDTNNIVDITIPKGGPQVERLRIAARLNNTGDFFLIIDDKIGASSYFTLDANGNYVYRFRNEGSYPAIDLTESIKLFDNVPLTAGAQEFIPGNRLVYGDVTEGFDQVDVDASVNVTYADSPISSAENKTISIQGKIYIQNPFAFGSEAQKLNQPIHSLTNSSDKSTWVFGGVGQITADNTLFQTDNISRHQAEWYHQSIPLGGFTVYLAGTDYYGVSVQHAKAFYPSQSFDDRKEMREDMEKRIDGEVGRYVYQKFSIDNVPPGRYIMRIASHLTTEQDLLTRDYQNTSSTTFSVANATSSGGYEVQIDYDGSVVSTAFGIISFDGKIATLHDSHVMDVCGFDTILPQGVSALFGYVVDKEGAPATVTADLLGQKRISRAVVYLKKQKNLFAYNNLVSFYDTTEHWNDSGGKSRVKTDHNGFFFFAQMIDGLSQQTDVEEIYSGLYSLFASEYDYTTTGLTPTSTPVPIDAGYMRIFQNENLGVTAYSRTHFLGSIKDQTGAGASGITVIANQGDVQVTDSNGDYDLIVYSETDYDNYYDSLQIKKTIFNILLNSTQTDVKYTLASNTSSFAEYISKVNYNNTKTFPELPTVLATMSILAFTTVALKRGGTYKTGLVYYDRGNRSGTVNTNKSLELPISFYTEPVNGVVQKTGLPSIAWTINHRPPVWATHYQWVRTANTAQNTYVQWAAKDVDYVTDGGAPSNFNDGSQIKISIDNLFAEYKTKNPDSIITYDFAVGDRIRFIQDETRNFFTEYFDVKIVSFAANVVCIQKPADMPELKAGCSFELYTPKLTNAKDIYYEIGEYYEIGNAGTDQAYHKGLVDQAPDLSSAATGIFHSGDTYYRSRFATLPSGTIRLFIDDANFSDFFISKFSDIGRPNIVDKDAVRVNRYSTIRFSGIMIPETKINALCSFGDVDFETYQRLQGRIRKLHVMNKSLDCYQELKVGKILINENIIYDSFGTGTVGASQSVLAPTTIPYDGNFGTQNPESFVEYGGTRFFYDRQRGAVLKLAGDGITPISSNKMLDFFRNISAQYLSFNEQPVTWGTYDKEFDEYVISFRELTRTTFFSSPVVTGVNIEDILVSLNIAKPTDTTYSVEIITETSSTGAQIYHIVYRDLVKGQYVIEQNVAIPDFAIQNMKTVFGFTLGFSERTKHWTSFYSYQPECMVNAGISLVSFQGGKCFLHNVNKTRNNFYGLSYPSESWIVFNNEDQKVKVYNAVAEESTSIWSVPGITTKEGQSSNLLVSDFQQDNGGGLVFNSEENIHHAAIWMDENTPNATDALINGDPIRSSSALFKFRNESTEPERMYAASVNFEYSERSGK